MKWRFTTAPSSPGVQAIYSAGSLGKCPPAMLNLTTLGLGGIVISPATTNYSAGDLVTLTATNARYYRFLAWSDGVTNNPRALALGPSNGFRAIFTKTVPLEELAFQQWDHSYGGISNDVCNSAVLSPLGHFYLAGSSPRLSAGTRPPIISVAKTSGSPKLTKLANWLLDESYGGTNNEVAAVVRVVTQQGFWIVGGTAQAGGGGIKGAWAFLKMIFGLEFV
jgi:hypothetical protein